MNKVEGVEDSKAKGENGVAVPILVPSAEEHETDHYNARNCNHNFNTTESEILPESVSLPVSAVIVGLNSEADAQEVTPNYRTDSIMLVLESNEVKSLTFEEHFRKPSVQRKFVANVLTFQIWMNLSSFLTSCLCTFLSDQSWFWEADTDLWNALIIHTVILIALTALYPILACQIARTQDRYLGMMMRVITSTLLRIYYSAILTFWFSRILQALWKDANIPDHEDQGIIKFDHLTLPLFFFIALYYALNLINHAGIICCLRHTQMEVSMKNVCFLTLGFSGVSLFFTFVLIVLSGNPAFINWNIWQLLFAAFFSVIDGSFILCSFRGLYSEDDKNSKDDEAIDNSESEAEVP